MLEVDGENGEAVAEVVGAGDAELAMEELEVGAGLRPADRKQQRSGWLAGLGLSGQEDAAAEQKLFAGGNGVERASARDAARVLLQRAVDTCVVCES